MRKVLIITDVNFWLGGAGHRMRISKLVNYLQNICILTVAYIGDASRNYDSHWAHFTDTNFILLNKDRVVSEGRCSNYSKEILEQIAFDTCIIEFIHLSFFLSCMPKNVITILDAHDLVHERSESFEAFNYDLWGFDISQDLEYQIFKSFNYVMLICNNDFEKIKEFLPNQRILLAPHPVETKHNRINDSVTNIGFIGSEYTPNVDGISYFINRVWPFFSQNSTIKLTIYGNVAHKIGNVNLNNVILKGYVEDLSTIYSEIDIAINPVRFGAGLKIKSMEALANGLPFITTLHGARGLEKGIDDAFLVARDEIGFLLCLNRLISNVNLRKRLSETSIEFIETNFSEAKCFESLTKVIKGESSKI